MKCCLPTDGTIEKFIRIEMIVLSIYFNLQVVEVLLLLCLISVAFFVDLIFDMVPEVARQKKKFNSLVVFEVSMAAPDLQFVTILVPIDAEHTFTISLILILFKHRC